MRDNQTNSVTVTPVPDLPPNPVTVTPVPDLPPTTTSQPNKTSSPATTTNSVTVTPVPDLPPNTTTTKPRHKTKRKSGPNTPAGKSNSSMNALHHGLRSAKRILPGEDPEYYAQLREGFLLDYAPETQTGAALVEELIDAHWFLLRNRRFHRLQHEDTGLDPALWEPHQTHKLTLTTRYHTSAERRFHRAFNAVEALRASRLHDLHFTQRESRLTAQFEWKREHDLRKHELNLLKEQNRHQEKLLKLENKPAAAQSNPTQASPAKPTPIPKGKKGKHRPNLQQWIEVQTIDGKTITIKTPSDAELLAEAALADPAPEFVFRRINFLGPVPPEYAWTNPSPENLKLGGFGNQRMTLQTWIETIERESANPGGHVGPTPTGNVSREQARY